MNVWFRGPSSSEPPRQAGRRHSKHSPQSIGVRGLTLSSESNGLEPDTPGVFFSPTPRNGCLPGSRWGIIRVICACRHLRSVSRSPGSFGPCGGIAPRRSVPCWRCISSRWSSWPANGSTICRACLWKVPGYTNEEIASRLDCVPRTIERKLARIRMRWENELKELES